MVLNDKIIQKILDENAFKIYEFHQSGKANQNDNNFELFARDLFVDYEFGTKNFKGKIFYTSFNKIMFDDSGYYLTNSKIKAIK